MHVMPHAMHTLQKPCTSPPPTPTPHSAPRYLRAAKADLSAFGIAPASITTPAQWDKACAGLYSECTCGHDAYGAMFD